MKSLQILLKEYRCIVDRYNERRKALEVMRADDEWITINGTNVMIDDKKRVVKGPGSLKSKTKDWGKVRDNPRSLNSVMSVPDNRKSAINISKSEGDDAFRKFDKAQRTQSGQIWNSMTEDEREAIEEYTGDYYEPMNQLLRTGKTKKNINPNKFEKVKKYIGLLTDVLERGQLTKDTYLYRTMNAGTLARTFGIDIKDLEDGNIGDIIDKPCKDKGFISTSARDPEDKGGYALMRMYAPKGTRGVYVEPFSWGGAGDAEDWDGESEQDKFDECEVILQRDTTYVLKGIHRETFKNGDKTVDRYYVDVEIIKQDKHDNNKN